MSESMRDVMIAAIVRVARVIEPVFFEMLYMSIIAVFMGLAILIVKKLFKNKISHNWMCVLWLLFILCLVLPIRIRTYVSIYNFIPVYLENIPEEEPIVNNLYKSIDESTTSTEERQTFGIKAYVAIAILTLVGFAMIYYFLVYIIGNIGFRLKCSKQKIQDERLNNILNECKKELNVRRDVILINYKNLKVPAIFGLFKIRILISDEIIALSDKDIYNIFLHELSHYERKDILYSFIITILRGAYIFNPIIWILFEQVRKDLELATDEYALCYKKEEEREEYIETLKKLEKFGKNKNFLNELGIVEKKEILNKRIENIEEIKNYKVSAKKISKTATAILVVLFLVMFTRGKNYVPREELVEACEKLNECDNVLITLTSTYNDEANNINETSVSKYYWKEARLVSKYSDGQYVEFINYANADYVVIDNTNKQVIEPERDFLEGYDGLKLGGTVSTSLLQYNEDATTIKTVIYEFFGTEKLNGRTVYKIVCKAIGQSWQITYWIDKEEHLILKSEDVVSGICTTTNYYTYDFDVVTDEDVRVPEASDYPDYEYIKEES